MTKHLLSHFWLSYGGGVNSTALAVMIIRGDFPEYVGCNIIFSDTGEEKPETYAYIDNVFVPLLQRHGYGLIRVAPPETVMQTWERLGVTGSRKFRSCSDKAKARPINKHIKASGDDSPVMILGIDAGEAHRAGMMDDPHKRWPLIEKGIDRGECIKIIREGGLCIPAKSGCWCCPFSKVAEVIDLARKEPEKMARIADLERRCFERTGKQLYQFKDHPVEYWLRRGEQRLLYDNPGVNEQMPCACYDG